MQNNFIDCQCFLFALVGTRKILCNNEEFKGFCYSINRFHLFFTVFLYLNAQFLRITHQFAYHRDDIYCRDNCIILFCWIFLGFKLEFKYHVVLLHTTILSQDYLRLLNQFLALHL